MKALLTFLESPEKGDLQDASTIKPDISDWTVTDLFGSYPEIGGSFASNSAALLDSTSTVTSDANGGVLVGPGYANNLRIIAKSSPVSYVSPELITYLREIKLKQDTSNYDKATVTVEELGEVPVEPGEESAQEANEEKQERQ